MTFYIFYAIIAAYICRTAMFKFLINNIEPEAAEALKKDLRELLTILGLNTLEDRFVFQTDERRIVINLTPSLYKAIKGIVYDFFNQGILQSNTFAMEFIAAEAAEDNQALIANMLETLNESARTFYDTRQLTTTTLTCEPGQLNYETILPYIFSQGIRSIIVAEGSHDYFAPKKFLLDNIDWLKQNQAVVVLENFTTETSQPEMDSCIAGKSYSALLRHLTPSIGKSSMHDSGREFHGGKFKMMEALCENGIALVAGDTEASNTLPANKERLILGNYTMVQNCLNFVTAHPALSNPFIVYFTGAAHAYTKDAVKGICELTGGTVLELNDEYRPSKPSTLKLGGNGRIEIRRNLEDLRSGDPLASKISGIPTALATLSGQKSSLQTTTESAVAK